MRCLSALRLLSRAADGVLGQSGQTLAEAVRLAAELQHVAVVGESVHQCTAEQGIAELVRATSKDELKGLLWRVLFWAMRNDCLCKPDAWAVWQGYILKEAEEARLKAERATKRATRKQVIGERAFLDV